jgi:DNA uptake protein ComE-like DNA-binding protein
VKVKVNTASQKQLRQIKSVGKAISNSIISERSKGKFPNWDELKRRVPKLSVETRNAFDYC